MVYTIPYSAQGLLNQILGKTDMGRIRYEIEKWVRNSGLGWTCNRLKALHLAGLQMKAGDSAQAIDILRTAGWGFSFKQGTFVLKGPWRKPYENFVMSAKPDIVRKWHGFLRLYTLLKYDEIPQTAILGAKSQIISPPGGSLVKIDQIAKKFQEYIGTCGIRVNKPQKPNLNRMKPFTQTHSSTIGEGKVKMSSGLRAWSYAKHIRSMMSSVWIPSVLANDNPCEDLRQALILSGADNYEVGHIRALTEPGCKVRVVAVPNFWCQWLMEPWHAVLGQLTEHDQNSAVLDQNRGAWTLQAWMKSNKEVFCYDLSSATDRFPLAIQKGFLQGLGLNDLADAFQSISMGPWVLGDEYINYGCGQPMGLYGSFPLFHATHLWFIRFIGNLAGLSRREVDESFLVLGDDVVFCHSKLAETYQKFLRVLGVEVSVSKTIVSSYLGQFAGFTCIKLNQDLPIIYRPYKWSSSNRKNVLNKCYAFGRVVKALGKRWDEAYSLLAPTWHLRCPDLAPLIPSDDELPRPDSGIDSYFLGSIVNRLCSENDFSFHSDFQQLWPSRRHQLLGQELKELSQKGWATHIAERQGVSLDGSPSLRGSRLALETITQDEFDIITHDDVVAQSLAKKASSDSNTDGDQPLTKSSWFV